MERQGSTIRIERAIARLAEAQQGAVGFDQLRVASVSAERIRGAVERGLLERVHRGVFIAASVPRTRATWLHAADLALRPDGAVSHADAAATWAFADGGAGPVHVTAPMGTGRSETACA